MASLISLRACQLSITPLTTNKSKPSKYKFTLTTMSGLRWKQPETMIASVGPPVMKPITLLVSQIQGFKGRSYLGDWALSWFPYKWCLLHSIYPLPWPWKWSSGSYCGLFLFLISSTQPASSPPPAENESLVVLSPAQQLRPPTRGCPSSLRGSSAHAQFNIRTRRGVWIISSSMRTTLPYQACIKCLDLLVWSCARCTSEARIFPIWVKWNVQSNIFGACAL